MSDLQVIADRFEIEALCGEFTDAIMMRDYDRFASLLTQDGAWRTPYINAELVSRQEIRAGIERMQGLWDYFVQTTHPGTIQLEGGRRSEEVCAGNAVRVTRRPLDELYAVTVRIADEARLRPRLASRAQRLVEADAMLRQASQGSVEMVYLHHNVAEARSDFESIDSRFVDQLQGHDVAIARQVQH